MTEMIELTIWLPREVHDKLKEKAELEDMPTDCIASDVIMQAMRHTPEEEES